MKIILVDNTIAIPLRLNDRFAKSSFTLNPDGECSDEYGKKMTSEFPLKYQVYNEKTTVKVNGKDITHKELTLGTLYPEATKPMEVELKASFDGLSRPNKMKALAYIESLKTPTVSQSSGNGQ